MTSQSDNESNDLKRLDSNIDLHADFPFNFHENRGRLKNVTWPVLYTRHSMTLLAICLGCLYYFGLQQGGNNITNMFRGMWGILGVYISIGMMVFPSGPFVRPHPVFWRLIFTLSTLYLFALVLFLFQTPKQMRVMLSWIDPKLGVPLPEKNYAEDCSLTYEAFSDKFDIFILAHAAGWVVKSIVMRDRLLCWVISITWEIVEITTAYFVPNFAECWWDQWILDVLLCNGIGIEIGLLFLRMYETDLPRFDWVPFMNINGLCAKFERARQQFTPVNWEKIHWENSDIVLRFFFYNGIVFIGSLYDMNLFTLKLWLWIPTEHPILLFRTGLFACVMLVSSRQAYFFCTDEKCDFLGSQAWVLSACVMVELFISFKIAPEIPTMPDFAFYILVVCALVWAVLSYVALRRWRKTDQKGKEKNA